MDRLTISRAGLPALLFSKSEKALLYLIITLQMSVKTVNNTAGPDDLVPTLLVFGTYLQVTDDYVLSPSVDGKTGCSNPEGNRRGSQA